jgi:hypothetical protein
MACQIVTISKITPLFKKEEQANSIELVELEEVGNTIVSGKGLFEVGDKALFIEPDYCIPNASFFTEYYEPGGDPTKSKLGNHGRIKAIKFNLHTGDGVPVYSYGILIALGSQITVDELMRISDLDEYFGVSKWEEPESKTGPGIIIRKGDSLPAGMYKTDEVNINNLWKLISFPVSLIGTQKIDGSSITLYCKKTDDNEWKCGICSRNLRQPFYIEKVIGIKKPTIWQKIMEAIFGWEYDYEVIDQIENDSTFVTVGKPYLDKLLNLCVKNNTSLVLRGELNGSSSKGSGNKHNPSLKEPLNIKFFGADSWNGFYTIKLDEDTFNGIIKELDFVRCKKYFTKKFRCPSEIKAQCEKIIAKEKANGVLIEGIVLRSPDSKISMKYMSMEYDTKK